jgi:hypothetical protein
MSSTLMVAICERRFALAAGRTPDPTPKLGPESGSKPNALLVGSGLHAGLAGWYKGQISEPDITEIAWYGESIEGSHPINCTEIRRLLRWYFREHRPTEFGRVLHIEIDIAIPRTDPELPGFTGAIDLIVECGEEDVMRLAGDGCFLPGPGVYGVDHKTAASASKAAQMEYALRPQFSGYCLISPVPLQGFIVNRIMKTQTVKRQLYYVPPPDDQAKLMVSSLVHERLRILQNPPEYAKANPDACLDRYGGLCPYLYNGCNRY